MWLYSYRTKNERERSSSTAPSNYLDALLRQIFMNLIYFSDYSVSMQIEASVSTYEGYRLLYPTQ